LRRAARIDKNQAAIVKALRSLGIAVEIIGKPVDLLACHRGTLFLLEVKNRDGFDRTTKEQDEFIERWPGKVHIVHTIDDAVRAILGEKVMA
jgi:hypothetical protein